MLKIYDEVTHVTTILQNGLSESWAQEISLLTRYYKTQGMKKAEIKKLLKTECEKLNNYNHVIDFKTLNKEVDRGWNNYSRLLEIKEIAIPREVLEWFLNLESSVVLADEQIKELKIKRPHISIKKNVMNIHRIKYLFTLYIWSKIRENYYDKPNVHYLKGQYKRFKQDANLKDSFNMIHERNLLFDLGYINVNYALGIDTIFMKNNEVFNTPITEENKIVLKGEDMYNCGYWLEKQKMGTFVCKNCGKEFAHYTKSKRELGRKYCKECADILSRRVKEKEEIPAPEGYRYCEECGELFELKSEKDFSSIRCPECQIEEKRRLTRERMRKLRSKCDASCD